MIPGYPDGVERNTIMSPPQQQHQGHQPNNRSYRGGPLQPGAAPSDGGMITTAMPLYKETTESEGSTRKRGNKNIASPRREDTLSSSYSSDMADRTHIATTKKASSSNGHPPQRHQHQQKCDDSLRSYPASPPPPSIRQSLTTAVEDGGDDPMSTITGDDIRRAYATLQNQLENHSSLGEFNVRSGRDSATGQEAMERPPTLQSSSGESGTDKVRLSQLPHIGSAPCVPTGVPVLSKRREVLGAKSLTAPMKQPGSSSPNTSPTTTAPKALGAPQEQTAKRRASAADRRAAADTALAALTREHAADGRTQPQPSAAAAADDTNGGALVSSVPSSTATAIGASSLGTSSAMAAQSRSCAGTRARGGAPHDTYVVVPVVPTTVKLAEGLGSWADETVAVGRLVDEDSRRVTAEREGEALREEGVRCTLERLMGASVKTMPLRFLKQYGYLRESQERGVQNMTRIMNRVAVVARRRAWGR